MGYDFFIKAHGKSGVPFLVYHTDIFVKINKNLLTKKKKCGTIYICKSV